jgi:glycosyltransferase involved in cell wall biosynthesis
LLPNRLSYPEILPPALHDDFLYADQPDLEDKLAHLLTGRQIARNTRRGLSRAMEEFAWENRIGQFDEELEGLVHSS